MVRLFDNTLRDGGNVVGHGFPIALTESIVQALLSCSIADIECGNCKGLGAYDKLGATQAPSDEEYFSALQPYLPQGRIGMFLLAKLADRELVRRAADAGLHFLRVGGVVVGRDGVQIDRQIVNVFQVHFVSHAASLSWGFLRVP